MTWWETFLAAWAPFALLAILVMAAVIIQAWRDGRTDGRNTDEAHTREPLPPPSPQPASAVQPPDPPLARQATPPQPTPTQETPPQETPVSSAELRRWARSSGLQVSDRGPIPARVREAWLWAHQEPEDQVS